MKPFLILSFLLSSFLAEAKTVDIVKGIPSVTVKSNNKTYKVERTQDPDAYLTNTFALTSRPSPPFFVQPFHASDGVETFGELEVLDFISKQRGLFIDARLPNWFEKSAIPSAVNIPFKLFLSDTPERAKILKELGGERNGESWDFAHAKTILLYCNGAWCGQSPTAIHALMELGYPKSKMKYYRGGMQSWQLLGLTTIVPEVKK